VRKLFSMVLVLAAAAVPARASDPIGIYTLIDKVVLEPASGAPERIQIWGAFALSKGDRGDDYEPARRGYLYLTIDPAKPDVCRKEWADLKAVAGTGQAIGFGSRRGLQPRIRPSAEKPQAADTYPIGWGLVKVLDRHLGPAIERDLKSAPPVAH